MNSKNIVIERESNPISSALYVGAPLNRHEIGTPPTIFKIILTNYNRVCVDLLTTKCRIVQKCSASASAYKAGSIGIDSRSKKKVTVVYKHKPFINDYYYLPPKVCKKFLIKMSIYYHLDFRP